MLRLTIAIHEWVSTYSEGKPHKFVISQSINNIFNSALIIVLKSVVFGASGKHPAKKGCIHKLSKLLKTDKNTFFFLFFL